MSAPIASPGVVERRRLSQRGRPLFCQATARSPPRGAFTLADSRILAVAGCRHLPVDEEMARLMLISFDSPLLRLLWCRCRRAFADDYMSSAGSICLFCLTCDSGRATESSIADFSAARAAFRHVHCRVCFWRAHCCVDVTNVTPLAHVMRASRPDSPP